MTLIESRRRKRVRRARRNMERHDRRLAGLPRSRAEMRDFAADMLADALVVSRERLDEIWIARLQTERAVVVAALDDLSAPSVEDLAAERGPECGTLRELVNWLGEAIGVRDAEIERLRRMTKQQANDQDQLRREINILIEGLFSADARSAEARAALDAASAPRERNGRALTLAERIAAAMPPLPEPVEEWHSDLTEWQWRQLGERVAVEQSPAGRWRVWLSLPGTIGMGIGLTREEASIATLDLRLALGPAGIPPTEPKP